jgi:hypothetical protein
VTADPALGFWLRAADAEGGLHELADDAAVVLLPPPLQEAFGLPEQVSVTADPEVARDDGALLLAPGHPVLDRATERVLDRGDVGRVPLAWPAGALPSAQAMVERLRDQVQVDHGRIDPTGELPIAGYATVLRVGALVTYDLGLDDRFQERQEVWVDADTGLPLSAALSAGLTALPTSPGLTHLVLPADRSLAGRAAQSALERRCDERLAALARQSRGAGEAELARVHDYYRAALDSLARRQANAPPDRRPALEARAEATRAERDRRLAEVEQKFRGTAAIRWYRVHELLVPTARVPVTVRRGAREHPFSFRWLLPLHTVAPFRCPHCAAEAPLVAGKQRLGCTSCTTRPAPPALVPEQPAPPRAPAPQAPTPRAASRPATVVRAASRSPLPTVEPPFDPKRCADDGNRLALRFWEDVVRAERTLSRLVAPGSPAEAAVRVWGALGPALVVGIPAGAYPTGVDAATAPELHCALQVTEGLLRTGRLVLYPYALRWEGRGRPGSAQVAEVLPGPAGPGARLSRLGRRWSPDVRRVRPPASRVPLDPVATVLWRVELASRGPHLLLRCLAAWWRVQDQVDVPALGETAVAAALSRLVSACAGTSVSYDAVASQYGAQAAHVRTASGELRSLLALGAERGW